MFRRSSIPVAVPVVMLIVNVIIAVAVAVIVDLASPQTCTTTIGDRLGASGAGIIPALQYRTCSPSFDPASDFIIGLLIFVAATVLELSLDARRVLALRREQAQIWRADDEATMHIHNVLVHMRQIVASAYGEHDRYVRYFVGEIVQLESKLREAAEQKDLVVSSDEFQSREDIEGAFRNGSQERLYRYTWPITAAGSVFTSTGWKYFFDLAIRMLEEGVLARAQALLILDSADFRDTPNVKRLMQFYATTTGAQAKMVLKSDFQAIAVRNGVPKERVDFGIYDSSLLYVTEGSTGRFTKDQFRIERYQRLFETVWSSAGIVISDSRDYPPDPKLSISQLLALDAPPAGQNPQN
jgi:hypothetical protein